MDAADLKLEVRVFIASPAPDGDPIEVEPESVEIDDGTLWVYLPSPQEG